MASKPFISAAWNRNEREAPRCAIGVAESKCELWGALRGSCLSKSWMEQASVNRSAGLDISLAKKGSVRISLRIKSRAVWVGVRKDLNPYLPPNLILQTACRSTS